MNNIHDTIKFTFTHSNDQVHFLDTTVIINNNTLTTTLYKKPTDRSLLLHFNSNHPLTTKESIIQSQALRYNLIIEDDDTLQKELYNLTRNLLARHYPLHIINRNIHKALKNPRHNILHQTKQTKTNTKNILPIKIHFNNKERHISKKIIQHWKPQNPILLFKFE